MGFQLCLTALLLVMTLSFTANGADNLMETVHSRYAKVLRALDNETMTHEYLEQDERDKWLIVDKVDEWIMGGKWRRDRVWFDPYSTRSDREEIAPDQTRLDIERLEPGEVRTTVIYDSRETWVVTERTHGTTVQWVDEALQADPEMSIIDYSAPAEPYLRYLPPYGYEKGSDEIFGRPCIVAECDWGKNKTMPHDGEIRIHTVWLDRDDFSVLRLRGLIYRLPEVWSNLPMRELGLDSAEILIENTALTTISSHRFNLSLPTETVISVDGVEDQITTYWYDTDLHPSLFEVQKKKDHFGIYNTSISQVSVGVSAKSDGPSKRHPRRDRLIEAPDPTPEKPSVTPKSKFYPKPGYSHKYTPPTIPDPAQKNPPAKPAPPPPPPPPPSKDDNSSRH